MKIYISGPMTGLPEYNYPAFNKAALDLRALGHEVYNPAEYFGGELNHFPTREAFADFCKFICVEADIIYVLPGYENSKGASVEIGLAKICSVDLMMFPDVPAAIE